MATTLLETSRWRPRSWGSDPIAPRASIDGSAPVFPLGYRQRLAAVVSAAVRYPGVEVLSAALDPSNGSVRVELLAPLLSPQQQLAVETHLQSEADHDRRDNMTIHVEFVDPTQQ